MIPNQADRAMLQACLNGARSKAFHPAVPVMREEIVADARAVVTAGANALHIHLRDDQGKESLQPRFADPLMAALREALPGTPIGVSTGEWIEHSDARRLDAIAGWQVRPDYASINLSEDGAPEVIALLGQRGIGIEAGLGSVGDAERLLSLNLLPACLRILIELDDPEEAHPLEKAEAMLDVLGRAAVRKPLLLHGAGRTVWPLIEHAFRDGYSTRVGLEDGAELPDGSPAPSNAALVRAAAQLRQG